MAECAKFEASNIVELILVAFAVDINNRYNRISSIIPFFDVRPEDQMLNSMARAVGGSSLDRSVKIRCECPGSGCCCASPAWPLPLWV